MSSSSLFAELCSCLVPEEYHWEVGAWGPCFLEHGATCSGVQVRARPVFCVRDGPPGSAGSRAVAADAHCTGAGSPPVAREQCTSCSRQVLAAAAVPVWLNHVTQITDHSSQQTPTKQQNKHKHQQNNKTSNSQQTAIWSMLRLQSSR
ncbi:unnamed protein product [Polarella glacialis]|uniref:Uncharacterized protein n=1 Tax=Polarella glacialis TaxID=89957 RepID=A0A813FQN9_POLGL|nr:unnamed protein product [Polarella glacialis]CAE8697226.1 unnamed protein product [Polarella glacialis]